MPRKAPCWCGAPVAAGRRSDFEETGHEPAVILQPAQPVASEQQVAGPAHRHSCPWAGQSPGAPQVAYFVNSGTEATDLALLMARLYTRNYDMLALRNSYHGSSLLGHGTWNYSTPTVSKGSQPVPTRMCPSGT